MNYKRVLIAVAVLLMIIYPEFVFTGLGIALLVLFIIFFVLEFALDIYIFLIFIVGWFKEK